MTSRVVFDCMVFLQGAACPDGPAGACLRLAERGYVELCLSTEVLREVREVLSRPKIRQRFPALTDETLTTFFAQLNRFAQFVGEVPRVVPLPRDPKDEKYLDLAVAAGASHLVSYDNDLLDLMDEQRPEGRVFRARFPQITIHDPVSFLRTLSVLPPDSEQDGR